MFFKFLLNIDIKMLLFSIITKNILVPKPININFIFRSQVIRSSFDLVGLNSFRSLNNQANNTMPPKKLSEKSTNAKRKVDKLPVSPMVKDPFTAAAANSAKKPKVEEKIIDEEEVKFIKTNKEMDNTKVRSRTPSPEVEVKKTKIIKTKSKESKENDSDDEATEKPDKKSVKSEKNEEKSKKKESTSAGSETSTKYDKEEYKKASNGKEWNLKIVSWNVNGIRAWLEVFFNKSIIIKIMSMIM